MPRSRNIKPDFFMNEHLASLPFEDRLLFIGLWTLADKQGRLEDRPIKIKMHLFPADNVDVNAMLSRLGAKRFVLRYEVENNKYIQVLNFEKHQHPHHQEKESVIPKHDSPILSDLGANKSQCNPSDSLNPLTDSLNPIPEPVKPKRDGRFARPSINQIQEYISENNHNVNAETFFNHYESNGWMVGKNSMKSWKAALANWNSRENKLNKKEGVNYEKQSTGNPSAVERVERATAERKAERDHYS